MSNRLGSWQQGIVARLVVSGTVAWSEVRPRGRAGDYARKYQQSFRRIAEVVPGVELGSYGPRGGLVLRYQPA